METTKPQPTHTYPPPTHTTSHKPKLEARTFPLLAFNYECLIYDLNFQKKKTPLPCPLFLNDRVYDVFFLPPLSPLFLPSSSSPSPNHNLLQHRSQYERMPKYQCRVVDSSPKSPLVLRLPLLFSRHSIFFFVKERKWSRAQHPPPLPPPNHPTN